MMYVCMYTIEPSSNMHSLCTGSERDEGYVVQWRRG
jgi:hypothetical protein